MKKGLFGLKSLKANMERKRGDGALVSLGRGMGWVCGKLSGSGGI